MVKTIAETVEREAAITRAFKILLGAGDYEIGFHSDVNSVSVWNFITGRRVPKPDTMDKVRRGRPRLIAARISEARNLLECTCTATEANSILAALLRETLDVAFKELRGPVAVAGVEASESISLEEAAPCAQG